MGELEAALAGTLPADLLAPSAVQGVVHSHTTWSDGKSSLEAMARAAAAMGLRYLTVTDHSAAAAYAGLDETRVRSQWEEIARVQEAVPEVRLFKGLEVDILEDGARSTLSTGSSPSWTWSSPRCTSATDRIRPR